MNRADKQQQVELLSETVGRSPTAFLIDFTGLDVAKATDLRFKLRKHEAAFRVVKNRLALRAFAEGPLSQIQDAFTGQTAVAYPHGADVVGLARVLRDFAKEHEVPTFKAGVIDGDVITADDFQRLADMPPRPQLIAQALYVMQYPISGLVTALSGMLKNLVVVLEQVRQQKESE